MTRSAMTPSMILTAVIPVLTRTASHEDREDVWHRLLSYWTTPRAFRDQINLGKFTRDLDESERMALSLLELARKRTSVSEARSALHTLLEHPGGVLSFSPMEYTQSE